MQPTQQRKTGKHGELKLWTNSVRDWLAVAQTNRKSNKEEERTDRR